MMSTSSIGDPLAPESPWQGRRIAVLGLGLSGRAAARCLMSKGAQVLAFDDRSRGELGEDLLADAESYYSLHLGGERGDEFATAEALVLSPGVAPQHDLVRAAEERDIPILSEIELASRLVRGPIVCVTGTNGKSTTATLIHRCLQATGRSSVLAGNIGTPASEVVTGLEVDDVLVLELSSFQLERINRFHPAISVFTNLAPDHLNRYADVDAYAAAKRRMLENVDEEDYFVFPAGDPYAEAWAEACPAKSVRFSIDDEAPATDGVWVESGFITARMGEKIQRILAVDELQLLGPHNLANVCAAVAAVLPFEPSAERLAGQLREEQGLPHRSEFVRELDGVRFIDDSKATNVHAARACLAGCEAPVVALLGGRGKGEDYSALREAMKPVRLAICYGEEAKPIAVALAGTVPVRRAESLRAALLELKSAVASGDTVVLSPACASFDEFRSFEERGDYFKMWANAWGGLS